MSKQAKPAPEPKSKDIVTIDGAEALSAAVEALTKRVEALELAARGDGPYRAPEVV